LYEEAVLLQLQFLGAAQEVTGSCFLLRVGDKTVLVECGLIQGSFEDEARNRNPFAFDAAALDAVVLTHSHLDHSGRLPLLAKAGYSGPIYTQHASADLCRILLKDSGYLNEKEVEWENRKRQRKRKPLLEPLYTLKEAEAVLDQFVPLDYGVEMEILPGVRIRLNDAGHILGSSIVELWASHKGVTRKLVFSGDLGHRGAPILKDPTLIEEADLVLMESTYGDRAHRPWDQTWAELEQVLLNARHDKGIVMIPAFAVGRTQELLYAFNLNYDKWQLDRWSIFLDSPMAIEATEAYARHRNLYDRETRALQKQNGNPFMLPNLHLSRTAEDSMAINRIRSGAIVIAGSGMCTGGRIKHHFKHNIWRQNCHVLIVGFQARGTLGRKLVDGAKEISLWGETVSVAARVHTIGGFSAHADCHGLLDWYGGFEGRPPIALVHGEPDPMNALAQQVRELGATKVFIPESGQTLDLVHMKPL
jgi:metallo-beta-lactamase family protein